MTYSAFQQVIDRNKWTFAKTYAAFCPHEYVVKERLAEEDQRVFEEITLFIRENGFTAQYGNKGPNRYYIVDEYYYWTMGAPIEETTILNRARSKDYSFVKTEHGLMIQYNRK